jgi:glycyl-tRNA synthetase
LTQHSKAAGVRLAAEKTLKEPREESVTECVPNKAVMGKLFKKEAGMVSSALAALDKNRIAELSSAVNDQGKYILSVDGKEFTITKDLFTVKEYLRTVHVEEVIPSVIEPSFGIGRIMYSIWEHNFRARDGDEQRNYLALPPILAPIKCSILPLSGKQEFLPFVKRLSAALLKRDVSHKVDDSSGSIGRRYARTDEIAIPFGVTIDFDTLTADPPTATLRERDSMEQIRAPIDDLPDVISQLATGKTTWVAIKNKYPKFEQQETKG